MPNRKFITFNSRSNHSRDLDKHLNRTMKKLTPLLILMFFSISFVNAQCGNAYDYDHKNFSDLEKRNLKGEIKSVTSSHYDIIDKFGEISKGAKNCGQKILFNVDGTLNKIIEYNSKGEINNIDKHEYENGEIRFISHYKGNGDFLAKTSYVREGNNIREQRYLFNGKLNPQWFLRTYDRNGNMTRQVWKNHENENETSEDCFEYDEFNRIKKSGSNSNSYLYISSYENDSTKIPNKVETIDIKSGKTDELINIELDYFGNIISVSKDNKIVETYDYVYDENENWIKRIYYETEAIIPQEIIERDIEYLN